MKDFVEGVKKLVRPLVTLMFSLAFVSVCLISDDPVRNLNAMTGIVVGYWFGERTKNGNDT